MACGVSGIELKTCVPSHKKSQEEVKIGENCLGDQSGNRIGRRNQTNAVVRTVMRMDRVLIRQAGAASGELTLVLLSKITVFCCIFVVSSVG
jgi:hypothetical protein